MREYRCRVRIVKDWEVIVNARNKEAAEREAPSFCAYGWGTPLGEHIEVLEIEHMPKKKDDLQNS